MGFQAPEKSRQLSVIDSTENEANEPYPITCDPQE